MDFVNKTPHGVIKLSEELKAAILACEYIAVKGHSFEAKIGRTRKGKTVFFLEILSEYKHTKLGEVEVPPDEEI